jgi:hypothetical protein
LFADTPSHQFWSRQANVMAVLTGMRPPAENADLIRRTLADSSLARLQMYFRFYLARAMNKAGLSDLYPEQLDPWLRMIANGMTSFGESDGNPRSECHPWSATPVFEFLSSIAGIQPAEPGFKTVRIAPALGPLQAVRASYPHPRGDIQLELRREGSGVTGSATLPPGLEGAFVWAGRETRLHSGRNDLGVR